MFPVMKKAEGSCHQWQNNKKVHFRNAIPAMFRYGTDDGRHGAGKPFVVRQQLLLTSGGGIT